MAFIIKNLLFRWALQHNYHDGDLQYAYLVRLLETHQNTTAQFFLQQLSTLEAIVLCDRIIGNIALRSVTLFLH